MGYGALEVVLFDREKFYRLYNCTAYNVDDIPLERRQHPILGACYILMFFVYETAHLVTIPVLYQRQKSLPCHKIMLYMSFFDFTALPAVALGTGVFMFTGAVFCSHPTLFYVLGLCSAPWWYCETVAAILLAFNRCVDVISPRWADKLFGGWKTWLWLTLPTLYGLEHMFFAPVAVYSGVLGCWHYNPHVGYLEDKEGIYSTAELARHNAAVLVLLVTLYGTFCAKLVAMMKANVSHEQWRQRLREKKGLFIQVLLISIGHLGTAFFFTSMFYVPSDYLLSIAHVAQLMWISAHGMPGVVYLTMNDSIRADVVKNLRILAKVNRIVASSTGPIAGLSLATSVNHQEAQSTQMQQS